MIQPSRAVLAIVLLLCIVVFCSAEAVRGAMMRVAGVYIAPDSTSAKLGDIDRGREVIVLETSRDWLKVEANLTEEKTITGWILGKGVVQASTPNGDRILFGEAVDSEDQASQRQGRRGAAQDAMHLYYRVYDLFPKSPLAGEALYRTADIKWQIEKADVMSRPSAREKEAFLREGMNEEMMREVIKKFPGTKWADLASFHLIENKLCGDWQGSSKCPEKEAEMYEKYAREHPQSPADAEALYDAAWRFSALIEIYKTEDQAKKSEQSKDRAIATAQKVATDFPQSDWGARAQRLLYLIQQGVPTYGNAQE
ncbi:MAG: SH3 domain-containing protein [Acidobacteriaceae bacterium]|nr:SH3 domain-containing protein [Acidobacteriaceae bacterium]